MPEEENPEKITDINKFKDAREAEWKKLVDEAFADFERFIDSLKKYIPYTPTEPDVNNTTPIDELRRRRRDQKNK